jgi:hypothetical protein
MKQQPFASPEEALEHYGVRGMRWGVRKKEETSDRDSAQETARKNEELKSRVATLTRTDQPQVLGFETVTGGRRDAPKNSVIDESDRSADGRAQKMVEGKISKDGGLSREQKMLLTFGAVTAAGAGYYAYSKYIGGNPQPFGEIFGGSGHLKDQLEIGKLEGMDLPKHWDMSHLKDGPISTRPLGMLGHGNPLTQFDDIDSLVVNTSRGYAEFLPKNGFDNPFAKTQRDSMVRVLEEMREKYPTIRNMNIELAPMSAYGQVSGSGAHACVLPMGPGEARLFYNDMMPAPSQFDIRSNARFLPGLGKKDYVAYHEIGHLFAVAGGQLPPAREFISLNPNRKAWDVRARAEPILHRKIFAKHGFSFKELSKISGYAATQPAEAMAELVGHYFQPEMRAKLSADQIRRAEAMINEMGGLG